MEQITQLKRRNFLGQAAGITLSAGAVALLAGQPASRPWRKAATWPPT